MDNILDQIEPEESDINEDNLWIKIWYKPTETLNYILEHVPEKHVVLLMFLGSVSNTLDRAAGDIIGSTNEVIVFLILAVLLGGVLGVVSYYIYAWALAFCGEWMGGKGDPNSFRTVLAWASVPSIASIVVFILSIVFFGFEALSDEFSAESEIGAYVFIVFALVEFVLAIWSLVILVIGIMIIQNFNAFQAILNMILPAIMFVIIVFGFVFLFWSLLI